MSNEEQFTLYSERRPATAGAYRWRVPSVAVKGLTVEFVAHMRMRGAGYEQVLSPNFDYWDGYRVHVPDGAAWQACSVVCKEYEAVELRPLDIELVPCPFCKATPRWNANQRARDGGVYIGSDPHRFNSWWLTCCEWTRSPYAADPRELANRRNALLTALKETPK